MTNPPVDPDDIDARFSELIKAGFGEEPAPKKSKDFLAPSEIELAADPEPEPSSMLAAWDRADAVDEGPYRPPPLAPAKPWSIVAILGTAMFASGVLLGLLLIFGVPLGWTLSLTAGVLLVLGLAILMSLALRRKGPPSDSDDEQAFV